MAPKKSGGRIFRKRFKPCKIKVVSVSTFGKKRARSINLQGSTAEVVRQHISSDEATWIPSGNISLLESDGEELDQSDTNPLSKHHTRRIREYEEWEKIRATLLECRYEEDCFVEGLICCQCDAFAEIRCKDCGHDALYCYNCAQTSHSGRNYFHVLETFKVHPYSVVLLLTYLVYTVLSYLQNWPKVTRILFTS